MLEGVEGGGNQRIEILGYDYYENLKIFVITVIK